MSATARAREEAAALDLTTLRLMSFKELDALYRAGKRPSALSDLDGDAIGAMLAWRTPATGPLAWLLQSFGDRERGLSHANRGRRTSGGNGSASLSSGRAA